jgi:predicted dienelactone hydrolase
MVWYPANAKDWQTAIPSIYRPRLWGVTLIPGTWDPLGFQIEATLARDNVPVAKSQKAFPLVIHSHGNLLEPFLAAEICELIASYGYVVAAPYHTRNTADDGRTSLVNRTAGRQVLGCLDGLSEPCADANAAKNIADRVLDLRAIMDNIGSFLGDRVDSSRVAIFGHSRGGVTALAAAGGSTAYAIEPLGDRLKGVVTWSAGARDILFNVDLAAITTPTVLIASSGDVAVPAADARAAYAMLPTADKALFEMNNAAHLSVTSGVCAAVQSAGSIVVDNALAFLDQRLLINRLTSVESRAYEFCDYSDFTTPTDIREQVESLSGYKVTADNVPKSLSADDVVRVTTELSVSFFNVVLKDCGHFSDGGYLNPEFMLKKEAHAVLAAEATYLPRDHYAGDDALSYRDAERQGECK